MPKDWTRRHFLSRSSQTLAISAVIASLESRLAAEENTAGKRINHSIASGVTETYR